MYNEILKIAKNIIAKNQAKKLLEYLIEDKYKDNNPSQNEIQILKAKINEIQNKSFNFTWFVHRFIQQKKHFQDIDPLLKVQQAYKKLNKELRTFDFNDNNTFSDFNEFMESYLNKNVKNQEFNAPTYCKLIHSDSKYNYYYAYSKDKKCYKDLHKCNMIDKNGQDNRNNQYAKWCVVTGSVTWGKYTTTQFPFYIYVTYKNNIPVMLFNFGYDSDCQIKDIHDNAFSQYDQELLNSIKQLAKKYNFDIAKNEYDFKTFNQINELYNKQLDELNIDQNIISQSQKYNGLNFIEDNIIYDFKKNKKAYLIANNNIVNLQGYKINLYLLNLLKDNDYIDSILRLAGKVKFLSSCPQQIFTFIIQILIDKEKYKYLYELIFQNKIKDENKVKKIVQILIDKEKYDYLSYLIKDDKIKDENKVKEIVRILIDKKICDRLQYLIKYDKIKDEKQLKQSIQVLINEKHDDYLYGFIVNDKIKDEKQVKQMIQILIDKEKYCCLYDLIRYDKIKDEKQVKDSIQGLIDEKEDYYLYDLIERDKIKDENKVKEIVQILIDKEKYDYLSYLIKDDKIKDENIIKYIIQVFIDREEYDNLINLIERDKIKDENIIKYIIQVFIDKDLCSKLRGLINTDKIKDENIIKYIIQVFIDKEKYGYLCGFIKNDKIKDENKVKEIIRILIDKKNWHNLQWLIENDKIKDENQVKQSIQIFIDKEAYISLYDLIEENKINQSLLTYEQKELLKKEYPNLKLSKKLAKIANILKG